MDKLIINAAITGINPMKSDNPHVPLTVDEIVTDAYSCWNAGASIVHIHARDPAGRPAYNREIYHEIFTRIREKCPGLLICGSTSGRVFKEFQQRAEVLRLGKDCQPDFGSLTLGSMNFPRETSVNTPQMIGSLAGLMNEYGIIPEWELFDFGMIDYAHYLTDKGILKKPYYANIILGSLGTAAATPQNLAGMVQALPKTTVWSAAGIGRFQFYINSMAVTMGGHVRAGLEDSLFFDEQRSKPATNPGLIDRIVTLSRAAGRQIASPEETRRIIGIRDSFHSPSKNSCM